MYLPVFYAPAPGTVDQRLGKDSASHCQLHWFPCWWACPGFSRANSLSLIWFHLSHKTCRHSGWLYNFSIPFLSFEIFQLVSLLLPSLFLQVEASFYASRYFSEVFERRGYKPKHSSSVFDLDKWQNTGPAKSTDKPAFPFCLQHMLSLRQRNLLLFWKSQSPPCDPGIMLPPPSWVAVRIKQNTVFMLLQCLTRSSSLINLVIAIMQIEKICIIQGGILWHMRPKN